MSSDARHQTMPDVKLLMIRNVSNLHMFPRGIPRWTTTICQNYVWGKDLLSTFGLLFTTKQPSEIKTLLFFFPLKEQTSKQKPNKINHYHTTVPQQRPGWTAACMQCAAASWASSTSAATATAAVSSTVCANTFGIARMILLCAICHTLPYNVLHRRHQVFFRAKCSKHCVYHGWPWHFFHCMPLCLSHFSNLTSF